jgi:hypothetical protein
VLPEVAAAVDKELSTLSKVPPQLPWVAPSSTTGGTGNSMRQQRQQRQPTPAATHQQLPRSARKKKK